MFSCRKIHLKSYLRACSISRDQVKTRFSCTKTGSIYHCDCNYVPGILRLGEMYDVAGLIAPRPFNAITGRTDPIFPIDQVEIAYQKLQRVYAVAGAAERCRLYIGEGGHRYYKDGAWPFVRKFFAADR